MAIDSFTHLKPDLPCHKIETISEILTLVISPSDISFKWSVTSYFIFCFSLTYHLQLPSQNFQENLSVKNI